MNPLRATASTLRLPQKTAWLIVALIGVPAATIRASDTSLSAYPPPLHPTVIMVDYKGKSYPVVAVKAEVPEIEVDGKRIKLHLNQKYQPVLGGGYGNGLIEFKKQNSTSQITTSAYRFSGSAGSSLIPGGVVSTSGEYRCTLSSSLALPGCYIAVTFFREDSQGKPDPRTIELAFGEIGDLPPGRDTPVKLDCAYVMGGVGRYYVLPILFSRGIEIRSNESENLAAFFRVQDTEAHRLIIAAYRQKYPHADHVAVPYLRFPPVLPDGVDARSLPANIDAKFAVVETGEVDSLEITPAIDPRVDAAIRRAICGWLFLPRLKQGIPERTQVNVPMSFGG
jgi:hypothetical protein